jgi:hypothetical protein
MAGDGAVWTSRTSLYHLPTTSPSPLHHLSTPTPPTISPHLKHLAPRLGEPRALQLEQPVQAVHLLPLLLAQAGQLRRVLVLGLRLPLRRVGRALGLLRGWGSGLGLGLGSRLGLGFD